MSSHVDVVKWKKMTIFEQMGNIGSEVGRAISAGKRGDMTSRDNAISRAIDLFDLTVEDLADRKSPRLCEVLRAKDQFLGLFFDDNFADAAGVEKYFMQFAFAARIAR